MKIRLTIFDDTGREPEHSEDFEINNVKDVACLVNYCQKYDSARYGIDVEEIIEPVKTFEDVVKREG